jgi:hypothetical protein
VDEPLSQKMSGESPCDPEPETDLLDARDGAISGSIVNSARQVLLWVYRIGPKPVLREPEKLFRPFNK